MELTRIQIILILGVTALAFRAVPQLYFASQKFPETWDRLLRYLSYALLCSIISTTLFMSDSRFDSNAAPYRAAALIVAIGVARWTASAVTGMIAGVVVLSLWSALR
jgi:branched-subunit amino acid transport protein